MNKFFSNPSYPILVNSIDNSLMFCSGSLNDSLPLTEDEPKTAQELYDTYFSLEKVQKKDNKCK